MPAHLTPIVFLSLLIVLTGAVLFLHHRLTSRPGSKSGPSPEDGSPASEAADSDTAADGECCGMHIVCERDSLSTAVANDSDYFDDEELDSFAGREAGSYSPEETEMFRDVLLTLRPDDIAPWARAIQRRGISLPEAVRDELLMIVTEARQQRNAKAQQ